VSGFVAEQPTHLQPLVKRIDYHFKWKRMNEAFKNASKQTDDTLLGGYRCVHLSGQRRGRAEAAIYYRPN
jgi:hypothetical protein